MNTYKDSNGNRHPQARIDRKIATAKQMKLEQMRFEYGYVFCEECGVNESAGPLDCSHDISIKEAKESSRTELCWTISNLMIRCRPCHQKKDKLNLQFQENENNRN